MTTLFLSYNHTDRDVARAVSARLQDLGMAAVFLDVDPDQGIAPGSRWEEELYRALRRSDAVVSLVTDASVASQWCFAELALARSLSRPVFPVRVSGTARQALLADRQEIDLGDGDRAFAALVAALRRTGLDPDDSFVWDVTRSPYPGLHAFAPADAAVFFGRSSEISRLLDLLQPTLDRAPGRWVSVVGPSGSGKSSLVHAGLLPRLARVADRWIVVPPLTPGTDPLRGLATVLSSALAARRREHPVDGLARCLADRAGATGALLRVLGALRDAGGGARNVLIVVDQAEELITRTGPDEQARFLHLLDDALDSDDGLWVVTTLRSEFLSRAPERAGLVEVIDDDLIIEPLGRGRLAEVITGPARRAGLDVEPGLVERMVDETTGGDALPLLAYTLHELAARADGIITAADYDALGGVVGALQRRADRLTDDLTRRGHGPLILPTLTKLAGLGVDDLPVRRPVPRSTLTADEVTIVDAFVEARLLTSRGDERSAEAMVEVSHEALLRQWEPLRQAVEDSRDSLRVRADVGRAAADWQSGGRDPSYLLSGNRLALVADWAEHHPDDVDPPDAEFLAASRSAAARAMDIVQRDNRRLRWLSVGLAVFLAVALVAGVLAVLRGREARTQADLAAARQLLAEADQISDSQPDASLLLTVEALRRVPEDGRAEARYALLSRLNRPFRVSTPLVGHAGEVDDVAVSPAGDVVATAGHDGTVRFWNVADGRSLGQLPLTEPQRVRSIAFDRTGSVLAVVSGPTVRLWDVATRQPHGPPLLGHRKDVVKAVFSPDGSLVASVSLDGTLRLWDVATAQQHGTPLVGHTDYVFDAAFTPDGSTLVSASWDDRIRLWDVRSGQPGPVLVGHTNDATAVVVSTDGTTAVSSGEDGAVLVWDLPTGRLRHRLTGHLGPVSALALSPDGSIVASGDARTVRLWSTASGEPLGPPLTGHTRVVIALRFVTKDRVVSASRDGTLRMWDTTKLAADGPPLTGHTGWINGIAVGPDGTVLASASGDGTARLWRVAETRPVGRPLADAGGPFEDVAVGPTVVAGAGSDGAVQLWEARTGDPTARLAGHEGAVHAVAFAPNGDLATGGDDTAVRFWDVTSQQQTGPPLINGEAVFGLAFSVDGRLLATAGAHGSVRLWDVTDRRLLGVLPGHEGIVNAVAFAPNSTLATGGDDKTMRLWDTTTMQQIGAPIVTGGTVRHVAFSPDGTLVAAGGSDAAVRFWDTADRSPRGQPLTGFTNWVNDVAFSPDGTTVAVAADDRLELWDVSTGRPDGAPLIATGERILATAWSPDGSLLVGAGETGASMWTVQDAALQAYACQVANRNLTASEWTRYFGAGTDYARTCP